MLVLSYMIETSEKVTDRIGSPQGMGRHWIHTIARHSNWKRTGIKNYLRDEIYADRSAWVRLADFGLLGLGGGFFVAGIVFFFAYNWGALSSFVKLGMAEAALLVVLGLWLWTSHRMLKQVVLIMAGVMVGVLFAVQGQIYQTGANAYDFFLGWSIFISLWVWATRYAAFWLLYMVLITTTLLLYSEQVATAWPRNTVLILCFMVNAAVLTFWELWQYGAGKAQISVWFLRVLGIASVAFLTFGLCYTIFSEGQSAHDYLLWVGIPWAMAMLYISSQQKKLFYMALLTFSTIIVLVSLVLRWGIDKDIDGAGLFLVVGSLVLVAISLMVYGMVKLNRKWHG